MTGFFIFDFCILLKRVVMVKIEHVPIKYYNLFNCGSNGIIAVAISNLVQKWRIFELFWPKSRILYFRTRFQLNPSSYIKSFLEEYLTLTSLRDQFSKFMV